MALIILIFMAAHLCWAQGGTPTPAPTATPETFLAWQLPTQIDAEGTPEPPQDVVFGYQFDGGEVLIALLAAGLLFSLWAIFLIYLAIDRRSR